VAKDRTKTEQHFNRNCYRSEIRQ